MHNLQERRRFPSFGSIVSTLAVGALALGLFLAAGVLTGLLQLSNPFGTSTVDRSQPALLKEVNDLSTYTAARGRFAATIDVEDDVSLVPSFIAGERTVFLAQGRVDVTVDFSTLAADAVQTRADGHVTITLPDVTLAKPVIDPKASHVASRSRGLVNRLTGVFNDNPTGERDLYLLAQHKLAGAAAESRLVARAERNTTAMLEGFLGRLGYSDVEVVFLESPEALG